MACESKFEGVPDAVAYLVRVPEGHDLDYTDEVVVGLARATRRQVIIVRGDVEIHTLDRDALLLLREGVEEALAAA